MSEASSTLGGAGQAWPQRVLAPTDLHVGLCAWDAALLAGPHRAHVLGRPSLIAFGPDADDDVYAAAAPVLAGHPHLPVMVSLREPSFARRLPELVESRRRQLGRPRLEVVTLWVEEPADLKGGALLQTLGRLRREGVVGQIGLAHRDVRSAEWLAENTAARLILLPYHLDNQDARFRALAAIDEHGMAALALPGKEGWTRDDMIAFALGDADRALPLLDRPIPSRLAALTPDEMEARWHHYCQNHPGPAPLPRSLPPEA